MIFYQKYGILKYSGSSNQTITGSSNDNFI